MKLYRNSLLVTLSILLPTSTALAAPQNLSQLTLSTDTVASQETTALPELGLPRAVVSQKTPETVVLPEFITHSDQTLALSSPEFIIAEEKTPEATEADVEETQEQQKPSPEEIARQQKFIEADRLYTSGQIDAAKKLYRELKEPFGAEVEAEVEKKPEAINDPAKLPPAGAVYWRQSGEGLEQQLESKIFVPLQLLVEQYPQFIPGQLRYAQALKDYDRTEEATQVLEQAVKRYPRDRELLQAMIETYDAEKKWLEASFVAREFALLNPDHPQAAEFSQIAEENLERYKSHMRAELRGKTIANVITGALGYAFTGSLLGPLSAIDSTVLLLRGESTVGESVANRAKEQLPMVEDEEVLEYVRSIGNKLAAVTGRDDFQYEFYVVMDDGLNAFALPGGKVFINAGAIAKANSEAELAGLLAHELSHAVLSHGFQLVTEGNLTANVTQFIPYGGTAANLIVLDYSRDMERQADQLGTRILASSGYAADGLYNMMVTLEKEEKKGTPFVWLSTHPEIDERIDNLEKLIVSKGYDRYNYEGVSQHSKMQEKVKKLLKEYKESEENSEREREE